MITEISQAESGRFVDLSIVLVTYNSSETLRKSLHSLEKFGPSGISARIVVVDNGSHDNSVEIARKCPGVEVIEVGKNLGFGAGNNLGMRYAPARYYYLHNTDAYLQDYVLDAAIGALDDATEIGIAGLPLVYPDQSPQTAAYSFTSPLKWALQGLGVGSILRRTLRSKVGRIVLAPLAATRMGRTLYRSETQGQEAQPRNTLSLVDWVCGAALILRHEVLEEIGGFDESIFLYGEDEDLCRMATEAGWKVAQISTTPVVHDFGWGKSGRMSPTVSDLKAKSLATFIDKNFAKGSMEWLLMRGMLRIKRKFWG